MIVMKNGRSMRTKRLLSIGYIFGTSFCYYNCMRGSSDGAVSLGSCCPRCCPEQYYKMKSRRTMFTLFLLRTWCTGGCRQFLIGIFVSTVEMPLTFERVKLPCHGTVTVFERWAKSCDCWLQNYIVVRQWTTGFKQTFAELIVILFHQCTFCFSLILLILYFLCYLIGGLEMKMYNNTTVTATITAVITI